MTAVAVDGTPVRGSWATLRRGVAMTPEFRKGLGFTVLLTLLATAGRVVVPIAVQQIIDRGIQGSGGPDLPLIRNAVLVATGAVILTAVSASWMNVRLYRSTESGLASLRVRAFRHIHDLSMLHQASERRGSLVSRVTSDVDQISTFMQWGGLLLVVSAAQLVVATVIMVVYSWQLTLLVYVCFVPLSVVLYRMQPRIRFAYAGVREKVGEMLGAVAESVVGASVIKAYGSQARTAERVDAAIDRQVAAAIKAQMLTATTFSTGELVSAIANAGIVALGIELGLHGQLTAGRLVAFLFLVTLFVSPVQAATEVLNEAQNAVAGWSRVIEILDTPTDVADPGVEGVDLPPGPLDVAFEHVHFAYPGGPEVLSDIDLHITARTRVAIVGETGSGKTTFAKLLTRLMDPVSGNVVLSGLPLPQVRFASLRSRVVMVPQDGFLFDTTVGANVLYGRPGSSEAEVLQAFEDLKLTDWLEGLDQGLATPVGERGGSLSAGERQLVALARAYLADPDLLVLDEATSAVDPATEVRLSRALDGLTTGRTTITIAHRLSTAEVADEIIVVDAGRIVQRGSHADLVDVPGRYADLHRSWSAHRGSAA
ncbi:MAG: ATP-binding cassette, subfamily bacterial [Frankiales bacterium]|nr:ATP-binding cassette, subfamily bacterial [Frankiales bacterium]MDX6213949.1 ATP-binding cassette, subfamily bacterial [Frankiales bacterium]